MSPEETNFDDQSIVGSNCLQIPKALRGLVTQGSPMGQMVSQREKNKRRINIRTQG